MVDPAGDVDGDLGWWRSQAAEAAQRHRGSLQQRAAPTAGDWLRRSRQGADGWLFVAENVLGEVPLEAH